MLTILCTVIIQFLCYTFDDGAAWDMLAGSCL